MEGVCRWSETQAVGRVETSLPVECPGCRALLLLEGPPRWVERFTYPRHSVLEGRPTRYWKQQDEGIWTLVE